MSRVRDYLELEIKKGSFPGCVVLYAADYETRILEAVGMRSLLPEREELTFDTIYDLASLTKPLVTALMVLVAVQEKMLELDTAVCKIFPGFRDSVTIKSLLLHRSGMPDYFPFFLSASSGIEALASEIIRRNIFGTIRYSCPGYILLKAILDRVWGEDTARVYRREVIGKLDLRQTFLGAAGSASGMVAPTENGNRYELELCNKRGYRIDKEGKFRPYMIRGEVHDLNSWHLGGYGGNAGLFASASDLKRLALEIFPETCSLLKPEIALNFWKDLTPWHFTRRSIGFKLNSSRKSSGGRSLERNAIGHNGFTGTSLWLERETGAVAIILTNAVHPEVRTGSLDPVRRKIHELLKRDYR